MKVIGLVRAHVGVAAITAAVILGGAGAATAVVATSSDTPVADQPAATTPQAVPSEAPSSEPVAEVSVAEVPAVEPPVVADAPDPVSADTVGTVTDSPQQPAPVSSVPTEEDRSGIGTVGPDGNYTPAPPIQRPGEPPMGEIETAAPVERLPGEVGYVPPAG